MVVFFFQAEDGIRDDLVTGVQTCALPIYVDEPADKGGGDTAPNPLQLLLSALGACTTVTLQMYAARKQWKLEQVDVQLRLNPEGTPASGNLIERQITLQGALDDEQRQRLLQVAEACPVHKLLAGEVHIQTALQLPA